MIDYSPSVTIAEKIKSDKNLLNQWAFIFKLQRNTLKSSFSKRQAVTQRKAIALISGGLDSMLATKLIQDQGIHVEGINFYTGFCVEGHTHAIRKRDDDKLARIPCLVPDTDQTGMGPLGCAILQQSRMLYKKKLEPGKKVGYVDQRGVFDFLVFYSNQVEQAPVSKD